MRSAYEADETRVTWDVLQLIRETACTNTHTHTHTHTCAKSPENRGDPAPQSPHITEQARKQSPSMQIFDCGLRGSLSNSRERSVRELDKVVKAPELRHLDCDRCCFDGTLHAI